MEEMDKAKRRSVGYLVFCVTAWLMALIDKHAEVLVVVVLSTLAGFLAACAMGLYHSYLDHLAEHLPERIKARAAERGLDII